MSNTDKRAMIFAQHPTVEGFHFTTDGQAFHLESDAKNHALTLEDKGVEFVKNPKVKTEKPKADGVKLPTTTDEEKEAAKAERKTLVEEYKKLYGKSVSPSWDNAKIKALIDTKKAEG